MTAALTSDPSVAAHPRPSLGFVPSLDGVRGLAVILVVAYHGGWFGLHGGFVGVDVFFVLSGFLITRLLLDEHARTGHVSLKNFYIRRALRLFPALAALVGGIWLAAALLDLPEIEENLVSRSLWAISYVANWRDVVTQTNGGPFGHLWSLSVEEQFYAVWPLIVVAVLRRHGARGVRVGAAAIYLVAMPVTLIRSWGGASRVDLYFATHSHGLVLLIAGSFLGASPQLLEALTRETARRLLWLGVLGIGALALLPNYDNPLHPSLGYVPVTAFSLALVAGAVAHPEAIVLSWRPLRRIGASSYGIYLWHLPMFAIAGIIAPSIDVKIRIIVGTAIATVISHVLIERPAMRYKHRWATQ